MTITSGLERENIHTKKWVILTFSHNHMTHDQDQQIVPYTYSQNNRHTPRSDIADHSSEISDSTSDKIDNKST
jgi:hypothetical protein